MNANNWKVANSLSNLKREALVPVAAIHAPLAAFEQVSYEQILQSRQIIVASRDRTLKPELLFSKKYWRTDNNLSACADDYARFGLGRFTFRNVKSESTY